GQQHANVREAQWNSLRNTPQTLLLINGWLLAPSDETINSDLLEILERRYYCKTTVFGTEYAKNDGHQRSEGQSKQSSSWTGSSTVLSGVVLAPITCANTPTWPSRNIACGSKRNLPPPPGIPQATPPGSQPHELGAL